MKVVKIDGANAYKVVHEPVRPETVDMPSPEDLHVDEESLQRIAVRAAYAKELYRAADARLKQAELARANGWLRPEAPQQPMVTRGMVWMLGATCLLLAVAMLTTALRGVRSPTLPGRGAEVVPYGPPPPQEEGKGRAS